MNDLIEIFPEEICDLLAQYGTPIIVTTLHGLSYNRIWCVCFAERCVVIKESAQEAAFYRHIAPQLTGVALPDLIATVNVNDTEWLMMEFIPACLPRSRWLADPAVMSALFNLHQVTLEAIPDCMTLFQPRWDDSMTEMMLTFFPQNDRSGLAKILPSLQIHAQPLFQPRCWISGDPNPLNWGMRSEGTVVLFDWERFGRGTPALDLAITVPGLGDTSAFRAVSINYGGIVSVRELALAKVWSVVEFFAHVYQDRVAETSNIPALVEAVPQWLQVMVRLTEQ